MECIFYLNQTGQINKITIETIIFLNKLFCRVLWSGLPETRNNENAVNRVVYFLQNKTAAVCYTDTAQKTVAAMLLNSGELIAFFEVKSRQ